VNELDRLHHLPSQFNSSSLFSSLASGSCLSCLGASSLESLLRWHEDLLAEPSGERRDRSLSSEEDYVIDDALP
jgi:hypothetical protein